MLVINKTPVTEFDQGDTVRQSIPSRLLNDFVFLLNSLERPNDRFLLVNKTVIIKIVAMNSLTSALQESLDVSVFPREYVVLPTLFML